MIDAQALFGFVVLGLAGSLHCMGMCGGFALAAAGSRGRDMFPRVLLFSLGKATTYVVLGLFLFRAAELVGMRGVLAWVAGIVLIGLGLGGLGLRTSWRPVLLTRLAVRLGSLKRGAESLGGAAGVFGGGLVTGLLPCGLSWGAFVLATQADAPTAVLGLFLFGLATTPSLVAFAGGWHLLSQRARAIGARATGVLLIAFGAITIARGGLHSMEAMANEPAPCHEPGPTD